MNQITENRIELFAIGLLGKPGYEYINAPEAALDVNIPEKSSTFSGNN